MKKLTLLFALLFALAACTPALETPGSPATLTPTNQPSATPTTDPTPTPKHTATPEASPTPSVPDYYPGLAPTIELFDEHLVEASQIKDIIADLRNKPSLLSSDAIPAGVMQGGTSTDTLVSFMTNSIQRGKNCVPAASLSVFDDNEIRDIIIFEILNKDYTRGYVTAYFHDKTERMNFYNYNRMIQYTNSGEFYALMITQKSTIIATNTYQFQYFSKLMKQEGYVDFVEAIYQTGVIPREHEDMILSITW